MDVFTKQKDILVEGAELPEHQQKIFLEKLLKTVRLAGSEQLKQTAFGISWALALQRLHEVAFCYVG